MFEQERQYKTCIFCGSSENLSDEHIFGDALSKAFVTRHRWAVLVDPLFQSKLRKSLYHGGRPMLKVAPRLACIPCNTGPSGVAVNEALLPLLGLVRGARKQLTSAELIRLRRYFVRVGAIMDVCTSNRDVTEEDKQRLEYQMSKRFRRVEPILSQADRQAWLAGDDLPTVQVLIGGHEGVLGLNPLVNVCSYFTVPGGGATSQTKAFTIVIGEMAAVVIVGAWNGPVPNSYVDLQKHVTELHWPPAARVTYDDVWTFFYPDPHIHLVSQLMRGREMRRRIEKHSRKVGNFELPPDMAPPPPRTSRR